MIPKSREQGKDSVLHSKVDPRDVSLSRLFPTPLASVCHPDHIRLNADLTDIITRHQENYPGMRHSNDGGWQSDSDFSGWSGLPGAALVAFGQSLANELSGVIAADGTLQVAKLDFLHSAWANISTTGDFNMLHGHPGSYWSAVYYVDDGRDDDTQAVGGEIQFHDPRGLMPALANPALRMRIEGGLTAGLSHSVAPVSGMFLMFPSWLLHAVTRYTGRRQRLSVAFNFWV